MIGIVFLNIGERYLLLPEHQKHWEITYVNVWMARKVQRSSYDHIWSNVSSCYYSPLFPDVCTVERYICSMEYIGVYQLPGPQLSSPGGAHPQER